LRLLALFFKRFLRHRWRLLGGLAAVPLTRLCDIAVTLMIGEALNRLQEGEGAAMLNGVLLWLALYAVGQALFSFLQRWWIVSASRYVERELKQDLFEKLTSLSFDFHDKSRSGDVVSRLTSDVENLRMFLGPGLMFALGGTVMVPVALALLVQREPALALSMSIPLALMGFSFRLLVPRLHRASKAVQEGIADISHAAQENFAGIRVVKGYARERQQGERFDAASRVNRDNQVELARARGLAHAFSIGASQVTLLVILALGGRAMIHGELGHGDALVFIDLTLKLFWPILTLGWIAGMYPRATASATRIQEILAREPTIQSPAQPRALPEVKGGFRLEDVHFTYPGAETPALEGINVEIPAGSVLGVVGPTGAGKTTLLHHLGRLYEAEGRIELDGVPLGELSLTDLRGPLGYVPQDSVLFSDSWRANVELGADEALEPERVRELAAQVSLTEEVEGFPGGYDQRIGERGVTLSGGQRQRTCIARALAREPKVLILDDTLSAVDTETERQLIEQLHHAGRTRTVVISAHRLSSVRGADQILVLDRNGQVEDLGTHDQLLEREGWYTRSWKRQQAREELEEL
jgi:ATP-binding cassette, subfamily B, multidrug efflux pump